MKVRPREGADRSAVRAFLARNDSARVARLGEVIDPLDHPALVAADDDGRLLGVLTYVPDQAGGQCEILALHTTEQWRGTGTALIEAAERWAASGGPARLWLITTNHHQRQRRRPALLPAPRIPAGRPAPGRRHRVPYAAQARNPADRLLRHPARDEIKLEKRLRSH